MEAMINEIFPVPGKKYLYKMNGNSQEVICISFDRATRTAVCQNSGSEIKKSYRAENLMLLESENKQSENWKPYKEIPMDGSVQIVLCSDDLESFFLLHFVEGISTTDDGSKVADWCTFDNDGYIPLSYYRKLYCYWAYVPKFPK